MSVQRAQYAAMVQRVEAAALQAGQGVALVYTPRIRDLERRVDAATAEDFPAALAELEHGWVLEIAKARRLARMGGSP